MKNVPASKPSSQPTETDSCPSSTSPASSPEEVMFDRLTKLEEKIALIGQCGDGLLDKVRNLISCPAAALEDEINEIVFFYHQAHEAFGEQLTQAFKAVFRQCVGSKRAADIGTHTAPSPASPSPRPSSPSDNLPSPHVPPGLRQAIFGLEDAQLALRTWANQAFVVLGAMPDIGNHPLGDFLFLNEPHFQALDKATDAAFGKMVDEVHRFGNERGPSSAPSAVAPAVSKEEIEQLAKEAHGLEVEANWLQCGVQAVNTIAGLINGGDLGEDGENAVAWVSQELEERANKSIPLIGEHRVRLHALLQKFPTPPKSPVAA